jgi:hypothetical protein
LKRDRHHVTLPYNLKRLIAVNGGINKLKNRFFPFISFGVLAGLLAVPSAFANFAIITSTTQNILGPTAGLLTTQFVTTGNAGNDAIGSNLPNNVAPFVAGYPGTGNFLDPYTGVIPSGPPGNYTADGQTQDPYVFAGIGGTAFVSLSSPQNAFSFLWGSVDELNNLIFLNTSDPTVLGTPIGTVTGVEILNMAGIHDPGFQGEGGSAWVKVLSTVPFNQVEMTSGVNSFEGLAFQSSFLPEPGFYGVLAIGLIALLVAIRRRHVSA